MHTTTITGQQPTKHDPFPFGIAPLAATFLSGTERTRSSPAPDRFTMVLVSEGGGVIQIGRRRLLLERNTLYWVSPLQQLLLEPDADAKGYIISFTADFVQVWEKQSVSLARSAFFKRCLLYPAISLPNSLTNELTSIGGKMQEEIHTHSMQGEKLVRNYLSIFLIYLERLCEPTTGHTLPSREQDISLQFFTLLDKHFLVKKRVGEYASMMGLTASYLNKRIKENSGFPASYHIQQRIVLEAKRHALFDGDSLKEVAYALGFCTPAHFSKYFKNSAGINFSEFRRTA